MSAETVPAENIEREIPDVAPEPQAQEQHAETQAAPPQEEHVPLSALQKERRKRQESERELQWFKEQQMRQMQAQQPAEEPEEDQAPVSRKELVNVERRAVQKVLETTWIAQNPEKANDINDKLSEFLKQRPHLARAIEDAPNRYEEAWTLMDALTPKQKAALRPAPLVKKDAPGNPAALPKAHGINQNADVMAMDDKEFNAWRQSQRKRR